MLILILLLLLALLAIPFSAVWRTVTLLVTLACIILLAVGVGLPLHLNVVR